MTEHQFSALTGRDIKKGEKYILVRTTEKDIMVVNVIEVVTEPQFDEGQNAKVFPARALYVGMRELSETEGVAIELSLDDIGCPWKGTAAGVPCRTFEYCPIKHDILVKHVACNSNVWRKMFDSSKCVVHYKSNPDQSQNFSVQNPGGETALPYMSPVHGW